jgi:hypothetical protein
VPSRLSSDELRKLVGIMERATGSDFDNEKLVSLGMARRLLVQRNLSWADVLNAEPAPVVQPQPPRTWRDVATEIITNAAHLISSWEEGFLQTIITRTRRMSPKQEAVLRQLADKYGVAMWASVP